VFADEKDAKHRPALVLSGATYHDGRQKAIVAAITSHIGRHLPGDYLIDDWQAAGLIAPSTVTGILRTIKQDMIVRAVGNLPPDELAAFDRLLRLILELP